MGRRYTLESLGLRGIEYVPDAHVSLDYQGAPTAQELEDEILTGIHTNQDGSVGCLLCGCVDMFYREFNNKGRRYRCNSCFYNSESQFESVKSKKDITLSSFGLLYICPICEEPMDSYNKATIIRHLKKHEDANKVLEAESSQEIKKYIASIHDGDFFWPDSWNELEFTLQTLPMEIFEDYRNDYGDGQWDDSPVNSYRLADTLNEFRWHGGEYPPVVLKLHEDGDYEIIDGFHRSNALQILDYDTVDAWVGEAEGEYGLWTQEQLDAPDAPWTPEVISPIFPLKGYEKPVEVVRAELQKNLVGQDIRMWHDSHDPGFYYDFGFTEPQRVGTMGKVTGISQVNPNRPWVIGVWVTIISGGSENHPIGSRVWFHVKDSHFPGSLFKGWHEGDYMKAEGEEALYWATRTNMLDAENYEIIRWLKVLRDQNPEDWDDIDWEDDKVLPHDDDWHEEIDWESEHYENYPLDYKKWKSKWDYEDRQKPSYTDYWDQARQQNPQTIANKKRLKNGGLFLNWLKTFRSSVEGYKRQCAFFDIEPVSPKPVKSNKKKQRDWPGGYPPYDPLPDKRINPFPWKPSPYNPYDNPEWTK